jgi:hypothetical protein
MAMFHCQLCLILGVRSCGINLSLRGLAILQSRRYVVEHSFYREQDHRVRIGEHCQWIVLTMLESLLDFVSRSIAAGTFTIEHVVGLLTAKATILLPRCANEGVEKKFSVGML